MIYFSNELKTILIANSFNNCKFVEKDLQGNEIKDGPLTKLLTNPNSKQSFEEFGKEYIRNLFSGGFSYLLPWHENPAYKNFIEKDSELLCLNNDGIDFGGRKITMFQKDISFEYFYNSEKRTFNFAEIIPFYDIAQDPKNSFKGVSRLKALQEEINQIWLSNKAIDNHLTLTVVYKYGLGDTIEVNFNPYIYGSDIMQYEFVWGFLTNNPMHYRMLVDFIVSAKLTTKKFTVESDSIYLYALEEEHWNRIKEFEQTGVKQQPVFGKGIDASSLDKFFEWKEANKIQ